MSKPSQYNTTTSYAVGSGIDELDLFLGEDQYDGDAKFSVAVDGVQIGDVQTVTAIQSNGQDQQLVVNGDWSAGPHTVSVSFLNDDADSNWDPWSGQDPNGHDRNLYVDKVAYNGTTVSDATTALTSDGTVGFTFGSAASNVATQYALGVYVGNVNNYSSTEQASTLTALASFERTLNAAPSYMDTYIDYNTDIAGWASNNGFNAASWAATSELKNVTPVIGLPLSSTKDDPDTDFKAFASGQYDDMLKSMVQTWVQNGYTTQYWRPGWEMNLNGVPTYGGDAGSQEQKDWIAAFQHVSDVLHEAGQQYGANVQVVWNPGTDSYGNAGNAVTYSYPGDQYVDVIGADVYSDIYAYSLYDFSTGQYDSSFQQWASNPVNLEHYYTDPAGSQWSNDDSGNHKTSLQDLINLAKSTGKPLAIVETGAGTNKDTLDNSTFVKWLSDALQQSGVPIKFVNIWDSNGGGSYEFSNASDNKPLEAAAWAEYFGGQTTTPASSALAAIAPVPTVAITTQLLAQDTGTSATDNITSNGAVTLSGTASGAAGTIVQVYDKATALGTATLTNGAWSFATTLAAGTHTLSAVATDLAGNTAATATQAAITIDQQAPTVAIGAQHLAQDTGTSATDNITSNGAVTLSGTASGAAGTIVQVYDKTTALGTATLTNGAWSFATTLVAGTHTLSAVATDLAGNTAATAAQATITVDQQAPTVAITTAAQAATSTNVTVRGVTSTAFGTAVQVFDGTTAIGTAALDGQGNWSYAATMSAGAHALHAQSTDVAGNLTNSAAMVVQVAAPIPPATDTLVLSLSEDAYKGDAQFTVSVDGTQIGGVQTVNALHNAGQSQDFTLTGSFGTRAHTVSVNFLNDLWAGTPTTDRNLYVNAITLDGAKTVVNAAQWGQGAANYALPTLATTPDTLVLRVSEDAYKGDAAFTVSVDGKQIGGTRTVTASHALGQSQDLILQGNLGTGTHTVSVNYINDLYDGTPTTDRNLYVDAVTWNGATTTENSSQYGGGAKAYAIATPQASSDTLVVHLSEDASHGDAQFVVSVDGKAVGGTQTVTALHASGQGQDFTLTGNYGSGPHTVAINFLNPQSAAGAATGRNLYVDSITLDGATTVENAVQTSQGTANYTVASPSTTPGTSGNDTITGSGTTNVLIGNGGTDTYSIKAADLSDTILNGNSGSTAAAGVLKESTSSSHLWFAKSGDNLVVDVLGTNQQTVVKDWYNGGQNLAQFIGSDGLELDSGLQSVVQAMAAFSASHSSFEVPSTVHTSLTDSYFGSSVINAVTNAWHR